MTTEDFIQRQSQVIEYLSEEATLAEMDGCWQTARLLRRTVASIRKDVQLVRLVVGETGCVVPKLQGK